MFAKKVNKQLRFHINGNRLEGKGEPILHNIINMFKQLHDSGHQLIMHDWTPREQFLELCSQMDIGMQVNFSETFNIVSADLVSQGVPIVGCNEIPWSSRLFDAMPNDSLDICNTLELAYNYPKLNVWLNQKHLHKYTAQTIFEWKTYFRNIL